MKKLVLLIILSFIFQIGIAQISNLGIGDTLHATHYSIHLEEINTSAQTISGYAEVEITPLVSGINYIALELQDLITDSVIINESNVAFLHNLNRLTIYWMNQLL